MSKTDGGVAAIPPAYASTFIESLTGTRLTPDFRAPGWSDGITSPRLSYSPSQQVLVLISIGFVGIFS
jgi:hypothetical protein